jgi:hypothetical protein
VRHANLIAPDSERRLHSRSEVTYSYSQFVAIVPPTIHEDPNWHLLVRKYWQLRTV